MDIILGVLVQGLIYGIMALGIYITYKILDFPDLTVDGSFPLGAAVTAILIVKGVNPYLTLCISFIVGAVAGMITGIIHVKLKVRDLLSGIIMMTALYTVNLRIAGSANVPLFNNETIFHNSFFEGLPSVIQTFIPVLIVLIITFLCKFLLDAYLKTKSGFLLRAAGDNQTIVTSLAKDSGSVKIVGLSIANGLVALGGSVLCQQQRFFDISMGTGTMVIGLASVIIGISLLKRAPFFKATTAVLVGAIVYKACIAIAIRFILTNPADLKLITAILFLIILVVSMDRKKKVNRC